MLTTPCENDAPYKTPCKNDNHHAAPCENSANHDTPCENDHHDAPWEHYIQHNVPFENNVHQDSPIDDNSRHEKPYDLHNGNEAPLQQHHDPNAHSERFNGNFGIIHNPGLPHFDHHQVSDSNDCHDFNVDTMVPLSPGHTFHTNQENDDHHGVHIHPALPHPSQQTKPTCCCCCCCKQNAKKKVIERKAVNNKSMVEGFWFGYFVGRRMAKIVILPLLLFDISYKHDLENGTLDNSKIILAFFSHILNFVLHFLY